MDQSPAATALLVAVNLVRDQRALISAVKYGITEIVAHNLDAGIPVNTKDDKGMSLLHLAAQGGHVTTVRLLIRRGCDVDSVDGRGLTPLHWAAALGQTKVVRELIRIRAVVEGEGVTLLHQAAIGGPVETVVALLEEGYPIDVLDSEGSTVLHLAAQGGDVEVVRQLVGRGCDVNAEDADGCTPLHDAADSGRTEAVCELIKLGAKKSLVAGTFGTPLHRAALEGHLETVVAMLEEGCPFDVENSVGSTVLHFAAERGHVEVVMELVDRGCDVNAEKANGCTPLHDAAIFGRTDTVRELIKCGANKAVVAGKFGTPLHQAVIKGHIDTVAAMLEDDVCESILPNHDVTPSRAQVEYDLIGICNSADNTPVMSAVLYGQVEVLKLLISKGGVISGKDKYSLSAFERCFIGGHASNLSQFCKACGIRSSGEGLKSALTTLITKGLVDAHKVLCLCAISGECIFLEHQYSKLLTSVNYKLPEAVKCVKYFFDVCESVPFLNQLNIPDEQALCPLHISLLSMKCFEMGFAGPSIQNGAKDHSIFITKLLRHPVLKETVNESFPNGLSPLDLAQQFELHDIITLIEEAGGHAGVWTGIPPEIENNHHLDLHQLKVAYPCMKAIAEDGELGSKFLLNFFASLLDRPPLLIAKQLGGNPGVLDSAWHPSAMIIGANVGAERDDHEYKSLMDDKQPLNSESDVVKRLSLDKCKKAISAMLNYPNGGYMHFGIGDDGIVEKGLGLEQNKVIDRLRREVGNILKDYSPPVQSLYAQVEPVNLLNDKQKLTSRWRFDIVVRNHKGVVRLHPRGHAYYRQGPQNLAMRSDMLKKWFGAASVSPVVEGSGDDTEWSGRKDQKD